MTEHRINQEYTIRRITEANTELKGSRSGTSPAGIKPRSGIFLPNPANPAVIPLVNRVLRPSKSAFQADVAKRTPTPPYSSSDLTALKKAEYARAKSVESRSNHPRTRALPGMVMFSDITGRGDAQAPRVTALPLGDTKAERPHRRVV